MIGAVEYMENGEVVIKEVEMGEALCAILTEDEPVSSSPVITPAFEDGMVISFSNDINIFLSRSSAIMLAEDLQSVAFDQLADIIEAEKEGA